MTYPVTIVLALAGLPFVSASTLRAAPFQNLDFEMATIAPATPPLVPAEGYGYSPIDSGSAFPHWVVRQDATVCNMVFDDWTPMDFSSVSLIHAGGAGARPAPAIQGTFDVQLYSVTSVAPNLQTASISQTGDIPSTAKSIEFLMRNPPSGANVPAVPSLFINGDPAPLVQLGTSGGIITMGADVSGFAGSTAELKFQAGPLYGPGLGYEDIFELDAISFSPLPIPEPASLALLAPLALLAGRGRHKR